MANNFFKNLMDSPQPESPNPKEQVEQYDAGQTSVQTAEATLQPPTLIDQTVPSPSPEPQSVVSAGDDRKYGFVEQETFDQPDIMEGYQAPVGYDEMQAARNANLNKFDFFSVSEYSSDAVKMAAQQSDIQPTQDYSSVGKLWRSVSAGVGSQIFSAAGDIIDWVDGMSDYVTGEDMEGRSVFDSKEEDVMTPYQRGEKFRPNIGMVNPLASLNNVSEYFLGIDLTASFTDGLRKIGNALETIDDGVEEQFRNEHGEEFFTRDEEGNVKVDYSQLFVLDFWLTKVAKQIPNMVVFAYTGGKGQAISRMAYANLMAKETVKKLGVKGAVKNLRQAEVGFKMFGTKFTGLGIAEFLGGGIGANLSEGAVLAGDAYKRALEEGLDRDQAATVGLRVMRDNAKYMAIDAMQYAIFDKGFGSIGRKVKSAERVKMGTGVTFKSGMADFLVGSGLAVTSGKMEEFQEIYQDWRVNTNLALMKGEEPMEYWDYFHSPEVAETRLVSFGMGFATGGIGTIKTAINDFAIASNIIDEKIEASGLGEDGTALMFAKAAEEIEKGGTEGGQYTEAEIQINKKHQAIESALLGSVVLGQVDQGKARIEQLVEKKKLSRQEADSAIKLMEDMSEAYDVYANAFLNGMPIEHKKEVARLGYRLAMERKIMEETNSTYESQKETVKADTTRTEKQKQTEISRIEKEQKKAMDLSQETIQGYQGGIEQVRVDALAYLEGLALESKNKRQDKVNEMRQQEAADEITKEEVSEAQKESAEQLSPKQREKRIKEIDKQIKGWKDTLKGDDAALLDDNRGTKRNDVIKEINKLEAEKTALQDLDKKQTRKKAKAKKLSNNQKESRDKRTKTQKPIEGDVGTIASIRRQMGERYYGAEAIIRKRLKEKGVPLTVYTNFNKSKNGLRHLGLSIGMSVYLDANRATQEAFFHELAHVYLYQFWDSSPVKALRKLVLTQPVMNTVKNLYFTELVFDNGKTLEEISMSDKDIKTYAAWSEQNPNKQNTEYIDYVVKEAAKKNINIKPDSQQNTIIEEAVVMVMAMSANNQDLSGLVDISSRTRWKNNMKKFFGNTFNFYKKKFSKKESKEILEDTGNEELANTKDVLKEVMDDYNKQLLGGKGKFEFRRNKPSFASKMNVLEDRDNVAVAGTVRELFAAYWSEDKFNLSQDAKGKYTAASIKKYQKWSIDTLKDISNDMANMEKSGAIKREEHQNFKDNKVYYLNELILQKLKLRQAVKQGEISENWVDNYLETRNKENESISKWNKEFSKIAPEIRGENNVEHIVRRSLWNSIHPQGQNIPLSQFKEKIEDLRSKWKDGKGMKDGKPTMTMQEEVLIRYIQYVEQAYRNEGSNPKNVVSDLHHDISGYKKIDWITYYEDKNGKVQVNKHKGAQILLGETYAKAEESRRQDIVNIFQKDFSNPKAYNQYLKDIVDLESNLKSAKDERVKRKIASEFVYKNFLTDEVKDTIVPSDLVDTNAITSIIQDNAGKLIEDTALFRVDGVFTRYKNNINKLSSLAQKSLARPTDEQKWGKAKLERIGNTTVVLRADNINVKSVGGMLTSLNSIAESITAAQSEAQFDSMIKMPGGEMTANISKKHQADIVVNQISQLAQTEEGKKQLKKLYPKNPLIDRLIKEGVELDIKQIIGGNSFRDGVSFDAGKQSAQMMTKLHIGEIFRAIQEGSNTYSQSISIFSDKSMDLHLNNAPLYSPDVAIKMATKLFGKKNVQQFINDFKQVAPEEMHNNAAQISLTYAINKYHARDIIVGPQSYFKGIKDYVKRAAGAVAMHVGFGSDTRIEPIMLRDVYPEFNVGGETIKLNATDAASFILPRHADVVQSKYGARNVGRHYKFVYYGQNLDNTTFANKVGNRHPFYLKTNTFVLTDEFVEANPGYKSIRDALEARAEATATSEKFVLPMVVFESANKVLSEKGSGIEKELISLEELETKLKDNTFNQHQDDLFTFDGQHGLDGSYLGIQTELDRRGETASVSKQLRHMLYSNPDLVSEANQVLNDLIDAYKSQKSSVFSKFGFKGKVLSKEDLNKIVDNVFDIADRDAYGDYVVELLRDGGLDSGNLKVIKQIITKNIIRKAVQMRGPGGLGIQFSDFGVKNGLKHYVRDEQTGDVTQEAEIILDKSVLQDSGLDVEVGDIVMVQRIPTSKLGDGVVCKVVQVTENLGTMASISAATSDLLGSDLDGDSLHIVGRHRTAKNAKQEAWNKSFDSMVDFIKDGRNEVYTEAGINELESKIEAFKENNSVPDINLNDLSVLGNQNLYISNIGSGDMIGRAAIANNSHKLFSAYGLQGPELMLNGKPVDRSYVDKGKSGLTLAYILNMFLDDANKGFASDLNLNRHTFETAIELASRNVSFENVLKVINNSEMRSMVAEAERKQISIVDVAKDKNTEISRLVLNTNDRQHLNNLGTIRNLSNLDTRMPSTTAEGVEMIDSLINLSYGVRKTRFDKVLAKSTLELGGLITVNKETTPENLQLIKQKLFLGDFNYIKNNITFANPMLQANFDTLLQTVENQRKIDPAYTNGYYQIVNRIFPLNRLFDVNMPFGMTRKKRVEAIEKIENRIRTNRLMRSDAYNTLSFNGLENVIMDGLIPADITKKNPELMLAIQELEDSISDNISVEQQMHSVINYLNGLAKADPVKYEYISKVLRIKKVPVENRKGYYVYNKDMVNLSKDMTLPNLKRVTSREEYTISVNKKVANSLKPETVRDMFNKMDPQIQQSLYLIDLLQNDHAGTQNMRPYMYGDMRQKVSNATIENAMSTEKGSLSKVDIQNITNDVLINNKDAVRDVTNDIVDQPMKNNMILLPKGKGLLEGDIVTAKITTADGSKTNVLFKVREGKNAVGLEIIPQSLLRDKTIPSVEAPVRDERTAGVMYMRVDESIESVEQNKKQGKAKDGEDIVDSDGRFGSKEMYMLVQEEDFFQNRNPKLDFVDYVRIKHNGVDANKLAKGDYAKVKSEYRKYLSDLNDVKRLEEMYFTRNEFGETVIEGDIYGVDEIYKIIKKKIQPLDDVAAKNLYNTIVKVLAAKVAIKSIDTILKNNKGLTAEEINQYKKDRLRIKKGDRNFKDISYGDMWMSPDISDAQRREVSEMLRQVEENEMQYRRDLEKITNETNKAYRNLLKDRFKKGLLPWWFAKFVYETVPGVRHFKFMNKYIFGNLVRTKEDFDEKGRYYRVLEMKSFLDEKGKPSEAKMKEAGLTQAEKEYYKVFIKTTSAFENHQSNKIGRDGQRILKNKRDKVYIPNMSGGFMETMLARNMTATFIGFNFDSSLRNINVNGVDPISGIEFKGKDAKTLGWFINQYMIAQSGKGLSLSDFKMKGEVKQLQRQAQKHFKSGKDAKGLNAIKLDNIETLPGAENFNRFTAARSNKAEFLGSYDIHSSLNQYIETQLFSHGLESQPGFKYKGAMEMLPLIDGVISYSSFKGNPQAERWVRELYKDRYVFKQGRRSLIAKEGETFWGDKVSENLMKWTMFVGLALKPAVAVSNIAIGKINEYRRSGFASMVRGEKLFWGEMYKSKGDLRNNKVFGISDYFGLLSEPTQMMTEGMWGGPIGNILFWFMTQSESYIQRAAFASQLTDAQLNSFKMEGGNLIVTNQEVFDTIKAKAAEMKDNVYSVQGRGYTGTDQRLIQNYFMINGLLQFKRWFPTFVMDRLGNEKIDRFGNRQIGSLRASGLFLSEMWKDGNFDVRTWRGEFNQLPEYEQKAITRAIRGGKASLLVLCLLTMGGAFDGEDDDSAVVGKLKGLMSDLFLLGNVNKLQYMAAPPMAQTAKNISSGFYNLFSNAKYQRETKYFEKGESKAKGSFVKLLPTFLRELAFENKDK